MAGRKKMSEDKVKSIRRVVYLSKPVEESIENFCNRRGTNFSVLANEAIREYINKIIDAEEREEYLNEIYGHK